jgi:hypothetical protein
MSLGNTGTIFNYQEKIPDLFHYYFNCYHCITPWLTKPSSYFLIMHLNTVWSCESTICFCSKHSIALTWKCNCAVLVDRYTSESQVQWPLSVCSLLKYSACTQLCSALKHLHSMTQYTIRHLALLYPVLTIISRTLSSL